MTESFFLENTNFICNNCLLLLLHLSSWGSYWLGGVYPAAPYAQQPGFAPYPPQGM